MNARQSLAAAMMAAQACAGLVLLIACAQSLADPYPLDSGEGIVLDVVRRLAGGHDVYRATLTSPPFVVTNYPPLFFVLQAPFMRLYGAAYWYGRLISEVSAVAAAVLAGVTL